MKQPAHLTRIDVLRAAAALYVVVYHYYGGVFYADQLPWGAWWRDFGAPLPPLFVALLPLSFGWTGVALFFVLSGYVIHRSRLLDERFSWRKYAARRFWRIYPAYLVVLVAAAASRGVLWTPNAAAHAALAHNLSDDWFFEIVGAFWSLAVEVQLYALYPLALWLRRRRGMRGALLVSAACSAAWCVATAALYDWAGPIRYAVWWSPVALWPAWLLGAWLAERHLAGQAGFARPRAVVTVFGALTVAASMSKPGYLALAFNLAAVASVALVDWYLRSARPLSRLGRRAALVGLCSYSIYLIHQPLIRPFLDALPPSNRLLTMALGLPAFCAAVAALSWLLYSTVERAGVAAGRWFSRGR